MNEVAIIPEIDNKLINMKLKNFIHNIHHNLTIDNLYTYKELTIALCIPYYAKGNQKDRQLDVIQQYVELEKVGRKYRVISIYDQFHPNFSFSQKSKYIKDIANVLLIYFFSTGQELNYITRNQLFSLLGFYNKNYLKYKKKKKELAEKLNVFSMDIDDLYSRSYGYYKDIIVSALRSLKTHCILDYEEVERIEIRQNDGTTITMDANKEQKLDIIEMKHEALKQLNLNSTNELFIYSYKIDDFYDTLEHIMHKKHPSWVYIYTCYKIYAPMSILTEESEKLASQYNINQMIYDFLQLQADRQFTKNPKHGNWLINQNKIINKLIPIITR